MFVWETLSSLVMALNSSWIHIVVNRPHDGSHHCDVWSMLIHVAQQPRGWLVSQKHIALPYLVLAIITFINQQLYSALKFWRPFTVLVMWSMFACVPSNIAILLKITINTRCLSLLGTPNKIHIFKNIWLNNHQSMLFMLWQCMRVEVSCRHIANYLWNSWLAVWLYRIPSIVRSPDKNTVPVLACCCNPPTEKNPLAEDASLVSFTLTISYISQLAWHRFPKIGFDQTYWLKFGFWGLPISKSWDLEICGFVHAWSTRNFLTTHGHRTVGVW